MNEWSPLHKQRVSSCVPYRTEEEEEEGSGRILGGEREWGRASDEVEVEMSAKGRLAWLWTGESRRREESLTGIPHFFSAHLSVSAFSSPIIFTPHLDSLCFFFPSQKQCWIPHISSDSLYFLFMRCTFSHFFHPFFHFFPLTVGFLCVCFTSFHVAPAFHSESLVSDLRQCSLSCATLPREWVSDADTDTVCHGDETTLKSWWAETWIQYMSAASHTSKGWTRSGGSPRE